MGKVKGDGEREGLRGMGKRKGRGKGREGLRGMGKG